MTQDTGKAKQALGVLGVGFGGAGVLVSLLLLVGVWWSVGWVRNISSEVTGTSVQALEVARERLLDSERRVHALRTLCEDVQTEVRSRVRDQIGLDEQTRAKWVELVRRIQEVEMEFREGLVQTQTILQLSHTVLTEIQTRVAPERLDRVVSLVSELETITLEATAHLDRLGAQAGTAQEVVEDFREQQVARREARLDELAQSLDDALLTATDAAQRSADFVQALRDELEALHRQVVRITRRIGLWFSFFLVWSGVAQICLARQGWAWIVAK